MGWSKDGKDSSSDGKEGTKDGGHDAFIYDRYVLTELNDVSSGLTKGEEIFIFI